MGHVEICKLCGEHKELKNSHIFPKFIIKWMKDTSTGHIRMLKNVNRRIQDGQKKYMLCGDCEQYFSNFEGNFANGIMRPYLDGEQNISYNEKLKLFLASILWRVLSDQIEDEEVKEHRIFIEQLERDFHAFLKTGKELEIFDSIHLVLGDKLCEQYESLNTYNTYFTRSIDGTVGVRNNNIIFMYAKFSRFIVFAVNYRNNKFFSSTRIKKSGGTLLFEQNILDPNIVEFMMGRAYLAERTIQDQISEKQRQNHSYDKKIVQLQGTDVARAIEAERAALDVISDDI